MTSIPIICRVQALYPFKSNDPSSLSFNQDDYIDVLNKLPSGWWDGLCNNTRGWFPSNYVKLISEESRDFVDTDDMGSPKKKSEYRLSLFNQQDNESLQSASTDWKTQESDFFFGSNNRFDAQLQHRDDVSSYEAQNFNNGSICSDSEYDFKSTSEMPWSEDSYNSNEQNTQWSNNNNSNSNSRTPSHFYQADSSLNNSNIEPLLKNSFTTNTITAAAASPPQLLPRSPSRKPSTRRSPNVIDNTEPLTWIKVSAHIALAIHQLTMAAKNNQHHLFHQCAASIVNAIRFMLITSSTVDKDSGYIKAHVTLRSHHRGMMASMSKLVLSAQTSNLDPDDAVAKILAESSELLLTVRSFVGTCQDLGIPLVHTDPHWVDDGGRHENNVNNQKFNNRYHLQINLAENLETMGNCIQDSAETIIKCISSYQPNNNRSSSASPTMDQRTSLSTLLFTHFRNLSNQTGLFLGYLDETDFSNVPPSEMTELLHGKQGLSIGLGQLFFKMQAMTDEANDFKKALKQTEEAAGGLYEPIEMICASVLRLARSHQSRSSSNASFLVPMEKRATTTLVNSSMMEDSVIPEEEGDYYDRSSVEGTEFSRDDATFNQSQLTDMSDPIHLPQNAPPPKPRRPSEQIERHAPLFNNTSSQQLPAGGMSISQTASAVRIANHENNSPGGTPPGTRAHTPTPNSNSTKPHSSSKLKRFFGDDAPVAVVGVVKPATVKEELDFLQYDYSPSDIVFNMEGNVKGGTLPALVERLTLHDYLDMNFINTFLLTYRSFCTSNALLDLLEARYNLKCPEGLSEEDSIIWEEKKLKLVRLRVFNVLKNWLELYYNEDDSGLLDRLLMFTSTDIKATLKFSNGQLESLIQKRREDSTSVMNSGLKKMILSLPDPPEPILPRNIKRVKLLDIDPLEMARQLTIIDFKLYSAIRPIECLDKAWSAPEDNVANNIRASIEYCNQVTSWVSDAILSQHDIKKRSVIIKYWVQVAEKCRILNNFNTCMAILSAFDNSSVGRLKRTWEVVGARTNQILQSIRKLMGANRNFVEYRAFIHSINPPCIPFLGIYLQDLTFIEDGNANELKKSKHLINFAKRAKTAEVIREIQQYQSSLYQLKTVIELEQFIKSHLMSTRDEEQLYKESLKLEPREREDEKITRLLQESGFL